MSEFDEYIVYGELGKKEKADAWQTAIGLQDTNRLKVLPYLLDTECWYIESDIFIDEVRDRINFASKSQFDTLNCILEELSISRVIVENHQITQPEIAKSITESASSVNRNNSNLVKKRNTCTTQWSSQRLLGNPH